MQEFDLYGLVSVVAKGVLASMKRRQDADVDASAAVRYNILQSMAAYGSLRRLDLWENAYCVLPKENVSPDALVFDQIFHFGSDAIDLSQTRRLAAYRELVTFLAKKNLPYPQVSNIVDS